MSRTSFTPADVCDDRVCNCGTCKPVDYARLRRRRDAQIRRENGGPGRPPWWHGLGLDPDTRSARAGRITPSSMAEY